jgi:hypothetical protein
MKTTTTTTTTKAHHTPRICRRPTSLSLSFAAPLCLLVRCLLFVVWASRNKAQSLSSKGIEKLSKDTNEGIWMTATRSIIANIFSFLYD